MKIKLFKLVLVCFVIPNMLFAATDFPNRDVILDKTKQITGVIFGEADNLSVPAATIISLTDSKKYNFF